MQTTSSSSPLFTTCFLPLTHFVSTFTPEPENESSFLTHVFKNIRFTYRQRENTVQLCILVPWNYNQLTCKVQCYPNRLLLVQRDWKNLKNRLKLHAKVALQQHATGALQLQLLLKLTSRISTAWQIDASLFHMLDKVWLFRIYQEYRMLK